MSTFIKENISYPLQGLADTCLDILSTFASRKPESTKVNCWISVIVTLNTVS